MTDPTQPLRDLQPEHPFLIGIDSDGCAFDTMEIKHKECFIPNIIKYWGLQPVSKYAREAAEFVNLYSQWRGTNRWPALVMVFDLLQDRAEVIQRGATIPAAASVRAFAAQQVHPLSNSGLQAYMAEHPGDPDLDAALGWTVAVNAMIADMVHGVAPFPYVRESLARLQPEADMIVVSATPTEALVKEWNEHDIAQYVRFIGGQEVGSKGQMLKLASQGRYAPDHILMIGDAPGDLRAARSVNALFYPILPGNEEVAWQRFHDEALERFLAGTYAGAYEDALIAEFNTYLPSTPPWKK